MTNNNEFNYKYSAPSIEERKEIESIRNGYLAPDIRTTKLETLRKLDFKVKNTPIAMSLIIGVIGSLIFGLGLTMILEWLLYIYGVVVCILGLIPVILAYPIYLKSTRNMRQKYSDEIIRLSNELLSDDKK